MATGLLEYHRYQRYFTNLTKFYRRKRIRTYAGIVFSILLVTFFIVFAIKPTLVTITALRKEVKDQQEVVTKLDDKIAAISKAQQEYVRFAPSLPLIDEALPKDPQVSLLTRQIEALATRLNVQITSLRFSQVTLRGEEISKEAIPVSVTIGLLGDYQNLKQFLASFSNLRRTARINGFGFKAFKKEKESGLALSVSANVFYLKEANK